MGKNSKMKHRQHKDSAAVANVLLLFAMHRSRSLEHICRSATLEALVGIPKMSQMAKRAAAAMMEQGVRLTRQGRLQ